MALSAAAERATGEARPADRALDFRAFHDEHFDMVWRLLVRFGAPAGEIEDLVQEVFTVAHRKLPSFRGEARVSTWLFAICRKVAAGARRRDRVRRVVLQLLGLERRPAIAPEPGVSADLERALAGLSETKRVTLLLHEVDGMSPSEIAALFGCPEPTVWTRLRLARKDLEKFRLAEAGERR
jgi:RNA polymerase sigma-70 factor (ECF subfamily)